MSEMVERVAKAIGAEIPINAAPDVWIGVARAAIEAMWEPTEAMVIAGAETIDERLPNDQAFRQIRHIWPDMIDEALR